VRLLAFVEYASIIIGLIGVIAGRFFALRNGVHLGVFMIGAGIGVGAIEAVFTRRMGFRPSDDAWEAYAGAPALIIGMMALLVSAGVITAAYLLSEGRWHTTVTYLARHPAPLLAGAGLLFTGIGVLMMLNPRGHTDWLWRIFVYFPRSLAGLVLVVGGLFGIGAGALEWLDPQAFDRFVGGLPRPLGRLFYRA
jgi:hypothetical protein